MGITLLTTIIVFLTVVLSLVGILLFAKAKLSPAGKVKLVINGQKEVEVDAGSTILSTLGNNQIFLPSACGGGGTCGSGGGGGVAAFCLQGGTLASSSLLPPRCSSLAQVSQVTSCCG